MKKIKFAIIKKQWFVVCFACLCLILASIFLPKVVSSTSPKTKYTIVIDAGHGGIDVK